MPGVVGKGRVQHLADARVLAQALRQCHATAPVLLQPDRQGAQAAQCQKQVVRAGGLSKIMGPGFKDFPGPAVGGGRAQQGVRVADDVFGRRLNRHINPVFKRLEVQGGGPGIVEQHKGACRMGRRADCGQVRHLERQ